MKLPNVSTNEKSFVFLLMSLMLMSLILVLDCAVVAE